MTCTENGNQIDVITGFQNHVFPNFVHIRHGGTVLYTLDRSNNNFKDSSECIMDVKWLIVRLLVQQSCKMGK